MTIALRYAIRSDVGLLREGNEDSAYAGPHLLAIADGMGGHAAGEVASAVAISALAPLDTELGPDEMLPALAGAVAEASTTLHRMSLADPSVEGMGTTLTALMWSGAQIGLCHIGDSRAYLLRDGDLVQITRDHTLVQSLVDEGRLSPAAAATHPQRSLVMRALQSSSDAEPDLQMREARLGDRYLLCSDGLSDVVTEETLHKTLTQYADLDEAVLALIDLAIRSGGPDNITCVLAEVVDPVTGPLPPSERAVVVGAAASGEARPPQVRSDSPAGRAHQLAQATQGRRGAHAATEVRSRPAPVTDPSGYAEAPDDGGPAGDEGDDDDGYGDTDGETGRRRWPVVTSILVVLVILIAGGGYAAWRYTRTQYYVGADTGQVVIYRGVDQTVAGLKLSQVYQRTGIPLSGVPAGQAASVRATIPASSLTDAQQIVTRLRRGYACKTAQAKLQVWEKNKPKPAPPSKTRSKKGKKTTAKPAPAPSYPPRPSVPAYCTQAAS
ncbi:MAG: protein phosphatase 2C domain-containing protein [Streptosporangiaceae bacterium]